MRVAQALPQSLPGRSQLGAGDLPPVLSHFPRVVREDLPEIAQALAGHVAALSGRRVLITGATGTRIRGKYTFVISGAFPTRLFAPSATELAKKSQITEPESASSAYGFPSE